MVTAPEAIVRALAAVDRPPLDGTYADRAGDGEATHECAICRAAPPADNDSQYEFWKGNVEHHKPSCPWRLAREWVAEHPEAT